MDSFRLAASVVFPLLIFMLTGVIVRKLNITRDESIKSFNMLAFKVLIPISLFLSAYSCDLSISVDVKVIIYVEVFMILTFFVIWFIIKRKMRSNLMRAATFAQGIYRSNIALFGLSVAASLCDETGLGLISFLIAIVTPTINILAVILFNDAKNEKTSIGKIILEIFKNPLVDAGILGILVNLSGVKIPELFLSSLSVLAKCATPVALIALGGMITIKSFKEHALYISIAASMRLVIIPAAAVGLGILLGFKGNPLIGIFTVFAAPVAVGSTPMTQAMGGDVKLAGEMVAVTSIFSILTIFLGVVILSSGGWIFN